MSSTKKPGYILIEMMLALGIFVMALAPAGRVLNETLTAYLSVEANQALHTALINHTNFLLATPLQEGEFESQPDDYPGITVKTTIEPYEPKTDVTGDEEYVEISNVFVVTVLAKNDEGEIESIFYLRKLN